jgi:toxin ParE1/3/4
MKKYEVSFRPRAETDLFGLYRYIAEESGRAAAGTYIDRIEAACLALKPFPRRGTRRDDIRPGLRTIGFERRHNSAMQHASEEAFVAALTTDIPPAPEQQAAIVAANRSGQPLVAIQ